MGPQHTSRGRWLRLPRCARPAWQSAVVLALVFAVAMLFAYGIIKVVLFFGGLLAMGIFAVVRQALRN
jgi:hypothetical protein